MIQVMSTSMDLLWSQNVARSCMVLHAFTLTICDASTMSSIMVKMCSIVHVDVGTLLYCHLHLRGMVTNSVTIASWHANILIPSFVMHAQQHGDAGPSGQRHEHLYIDSDEDRPHMPHFQRQSRYVRSVFQDEEDYRQVSFDETTAEHQNTGCEECPSQIQVAVHIHVSVQHEVPQVAHIAAERYNFSVPIALTQDGAQGAGRQQAHARALIRSRMERHRQDGQHIQFAAALNDTASLMSGQVVVPLVRSHHITGNFIRFHKASQLARFGQVNRTKTVMAVSLSTQMNWWSP